MTDLELFEAWQAGDRKAGARLVDRYLPAMGRFFANKVSAECDVHDLVAETFERCTKHLERFRGHSSVRTYLFGIAHNVLREYIRRLGKQRVCFDLSHDSVADLGPSPSAVFVQRREERLLLTALRHLPVELQTIIELSHFEELSRRDIAQILELPEGTVASRLRRAKKLLDEALAKLADDPALLQSTTMDLQRWARQLRVRIYQKDS